MLNSISLSCAFYCEVDPYYPFQNTTGNYFQYTHCLWQLITLYVVVFVDHLHLGFLCVSSFYFQEIFVAPVVFLAFLKMFLIPIKVYLDGRQTFSSWYLVPLWKVYRVWFIFLNLALFGSALSHSFLPYFIYLNEINLWACVALFIFYAQ